MPGQSGSLKCRLGSQRAPLPNLVPLPISVVTLENFLTFLKIIKFSQLNDVIIRMLTLKE